MNNDMKNSQAQALNVRQSELAPGSGMDETLSIINAELNQTRLDRFREWVRNADADLSKYDEQIERLETERSRLRELLLQAKQNGQAVRLNNILEVTLEERAA